MIVYILDAEGNTQHVSLQEYDKWEEKIPKHERSVLGKKLAVNIVGSVQVITYFICTPIGYYGRKPQLWYTVTSGPDMWVERRYSSHRAAMSGHVKACVEVTNGRKRRRKSAEKPASAVVKAE